MAPTEIRSSHTFKFHEVSTAAQYAEAVLRVCDFQQHHYLFQHPIHASSTFLHSSDPAGLPVPAAYPPYVVVSIDLACPQRRCPPPMTGYTVRTIIREAKGSAVVFQHVIEAERDHDLVSWQGAKGTRRVLAQLEVTTVLLAGVPAAGERPRMDKVDLRDARPGVLFDIERTAPINISTSTALDMAHTTETSVVARYTDCDGLGHVTASRLFIMLLESAINRVGFQPCSNNGIATNPFQRVHCRLVRQVAPATEVHLCVSHPSSQGTMSVVGSVTGSDSQKQLKSITGSVKLRPIEGVENAQPEHAISRL